MPGRLIAVFPALLPMPGRLIAVFPALLPMPGRLIAVFPALLPMPGRLPCVGMLAPPPRPGRFPPPPGVGNGAGFGRATWAGPGAGRAAGIGRAAAGAWGRAAGVGALNAGVRLKAGRAPACAPAPGRAPPAWPPARCARAVPPHRARARAIASARMILWFMAVSSLAGGVGIEGGPSEVSAVLEPG